MVVAREVLKDYKAADGQFPSYIRHRRVEHASAARVGPVPAAAPPPAR